MRRFRRDREGATIVEFAVVAPVFFLLVLGIIEFGLFMFHKVVVESIALQVGREASLGKSAVSDCGGGGGKYGHIYCYVREKSGGIINPNELMVDITPLPETGSGTGTITPDICLDSNPPSSRPATCSRFEDVNGDGRYTGYAEASNPGNASELVEVRISYPWQTIVPMMDRLIGSFNDNNDEEKGRTGVVMITASTIFRNEPFD